MPEEPDEFLIDDRCIIIPDPNAAESVEVIRGPNIKALPINQPMENTIEKSVLLKVEDNITTDHIMPAGAKVLPYRSNIEKISQFVFRDVCADFAKRCQNHNGGIIIAGSNYGQGSSREHAALAPMYLGIKAVIAKSFARIHHANLINFGILPLQFADEADYDKIDEGDVIQLNNLHNLKPNQTIIANNLTKNSKLTLTYALSELDIRTLAYGGTLNLIKAENQVK